MIEKLTLLSLIVILLVVHAMGQEKTRLKQPDFFPVSVWYSGGKARAPMLSTITPNSRAEWKKDLQQIKSLGFNTVRTWVEWAHCEPRPGEYHFENLKLLCELAQEVGLRVIIQMYVDSAPDWVGKKFPDGLFETQSGDKVHSQAAPGFCTDHAGVREAVLNFYTETAKVAVQYPNFHGWDLWSEPHIVNWAYINYVPNVQFCFCPHTQAKFRDWLRQKYGTLANLNQAWYRNFESWDEVHPPRFGTILSYTDFIDWKNFIYEKLAGDLRMRYEAVRRADKTHVITSHAAVPSIFYSPFNGYGATDDFLMAEQVDFYGTSLYPKHNHPARHWELWKFQVAVDFSRSANLKNGGFYVGELQAGKGTIGLQIGNPITPEDHRLWMWSVVAKGAKAINIYAYYPMSSGYESGGYGLINLDGSLTERAQRAGEIARIIHQNQQLLLESKPIPAQIAIVYNPLAQMVGGEQRGDFDGHQNSLIGYYRFFVEHNIPVDFIHRRNLETGDVSQYQLIIVPYPLMFSQKAADGLKKFVSDGGHVVAEARLAWNDERGFAADVIPGMGLHEVFGAIESQVKMAERAKLVVANNVHPVLKGLSSGDTLKGAYFAESLELLKGRQDQILATLDDGTPGIIASRFGKGETILIGSFLGLANHPIADQSNNHFLKNLLDWAGIVRPVTTSHDGQPDNPIEVRLQENRDGQLLFILNHGEQREQLHVRLKVKKDGMLDLHEIITNQKLQLKSKNSVLEFDSSIAGKEVQVWRIGL
ncbi:MAG: beta-galactosidase [candidate division KSB1 bacterium]|nr:beta-galactosidase [candidate division KSB1 bacterium]